MYLWINRYILWRGSKSSLWINNQIREWYIKVNKMNINYQVRLIRLEYKRWAVISSKIVNKYPAMIFICKSSVWFFLFSSDKLGQIPILFYQGNGWHCRHIHAHIKNCIAGNKQSYINKSWTTFGFMTFIEKVSQYSWQEYDTHSDRLKRKRSLWWENTLLQFTGTSCYLRHWSK